MTANATMTNATITEDCGLFDDSGNYRKATDAANANGIIVANALRDISASAKPLGYAAARPLVRALMEEGYSPMEAARLYVRPITDDLVRYGLDDVANVRDNMRTCFRNVCKAVERESAEDVKVSVKFKLSKASANNPQTSHNGRLATLANKPAHFSVTFDVADVQTSADTLACEKLDETGAELEAIAAFYDAMPDGHDVVTPERQQTEAYQIGQLATAMTARELYNGELAAAQTLWLAQRAEIAALKAELAALKATRKPAARKARKLTAN